MPEPLTFLMGKHPAPLPADRRYCRNHMWCRPEGPAFRFGFTAYAVRLMQDVYFLEWNVDAGTAVALKQPIGFLESSKAQSELYAPLAGTIVAFNKALLNDPSAINADGYGAGWLFEMAADPAGTMGVEEYHAFLAAGWEQTQRLLKKQVHETVDE
jgi:glycine cleavage system H protein